VGPCDIVFCLQLSRLSRDSDGGMSEGDSLRQQAVLDAQYALMQQLVPGETMQPNQLAMVMVTQYHLSHRKLSHRHIPLPQTLPLPLHVCARVCVSVCVWSRPLHVELYTDAAHVTFLEILHKEHMQGQTYEQLDRGEVGRLGKRGQEVPGIVRSNSVA